MDKETKVRFDGIVESDNHPQNRLRSSLLEMPKDKRKQVIDWEKCKARHNELDSKGKF